MINDNKTINFLINKTIKDYISEIYKHGQMSIEDITNLLILWNNGCNTDCFRSKNVDFPNPFLWRLVIKLLKRFILRKKTILHMEIVKSFKN